MHSFDVTRGLIQVRQPLSRLTRTPTAFRKKSEDIRHTYKRSCGAVGGQTLREHGQAFVLLQNRESRA
jgi:hypothetical protein